MVSGLFRSVFGLGLLLGGVWCSFHVQLGTRTLAEHADRIGQTPEAQELLEGSRATLTPLLEEAAHRALGEYVEAPTSAPTSPRAEPVGSGPVAPGPDIPEAAGVPVVRRPRPRKPGGAGL